MSDALVTVRHREDAILAYKMCSERVERVGLDIEAEITYAPGQHVEALEAVDRMAAELRRQIADAAESVPNPALPGVTFAEVSENIRRFQAFVREAGES